MRLEARPWGALGGTAVLLGLIVACGPTATVTAPPTPSASATSSAAATASERADAATRPPTPSPTATAAPSALPGGLEGRVEIPGLAITLPDGWKTLPLDRQDFEELIDAYPIDSPVRTLLESQVGTIAVTGIRLFAVDARPRSDIFGANLNVLELPNMPLPLYSGVIEGQLEMLGATEVEVDDIELPAGEALRARFALDVPIDGGATVRVVAAQYVVASGEQLFIVSIGAPISGEKLEPDVHRLLEDVARTIEVEA
jgi:hypothetical protein